VNFGNLLVMEFFSIFLSHIVTFPDMEFTMSNA